MDKDEKEYKSWKVTEGGEEVCHWVPGEDEKWSEYIIPPCKKCGSNNVVMRVYYNCGMVMYYCLDCSHSQAVPKQSNVERRRGNVYSRWREKKLEKNPACVVCGSTTNLEVHHIIPVEFSPELVLCETNGITLCRDCHKMVHNSRRWNSRKE